RAQDAGQRLHQSHQSLHSSVSEQLGAMKLVKGMGAEESHIAGFASSAEQVASDLLAFTRISAMTRLWFRLGAALTLACLCYVAVAQLSVPTGTLLVLVAVFIRLLPQLSGLQQSWQQVVHIQPTFESLERLQAEVSAAREPEEGSAADSLTLSD